MAAEARDGELAMLGRRLRSRQVTAVDLVERALRRIEATTELNAVVALSDVALDEARSRDRSVERGEVPQPLHGLPFLVKDVEDVAGLPTTSGSLLRRSARAALRDGQVPGRLRSAGAVPVGKTNVPEFAFEGYTSNRLHGATRNPWAPAWSPGGSSGGSAAVLAAGVAPIATATDGGGSIRIPAALCGLIGLKPSNDLLIADPIPTWMDLSTDGPLATTTADLRLIMSVLLGSDFGDPPTSRGNASLPPAPTPTRVLAIERIVAGPELDDQMHQLFTGSVLTLQGELDLEVEWLADGLFQTGDADHDWYVIAAVESAQELGREVVERALEDDVFEAGFARWMRGALEIQLDEYVEARRRRMAYSRALDVLLGEDVVLATPTLTVSGWTPEGLIPGREHEGPGLPLDALNTSAVNLCGHPAVSIPAGSFPDGRPFGLQLVGPRFSDAALLTLASAWEAVRPWPRVASGFRPFLD